MFTFQIFFNCHVTTSKDVEIVPLKDLQRYLFSAFWVPPSEIEVKKFKITLSFGKYLYNSTSSVMFRRTHIIGTFFLFFGTV